MSHPNPFAEVEATLASPPADGVFAARVDPNSPHFAAGLRVGDVVVRVGEDAVVDLRSFFGAMQPKGPEDATRTLAVVRGADTHQLDSVAGIGGASFCAVKKGERAWEVHTDYEEEPDFSGLEDETEIWLRSSFGDDPAGFEWIHVSRDGAALVVKHVMRLGGTHEGQPWDYCTLGLTTHGVDRTLSVSRTAFFHGLGEKETLVGDVALGTDGWWRGVRRKGEEDEQVAVEATTPHLLTGYAVMLLPLTMPLREGACLTFYGAGDGVASVTGRGRLECLGRRETQVGGKTVEAVCFAWRHYGARAPEDDEHFYVSDDRRLLRVDWGPDYNGCWSEAMAREEIFATIPEHLRGDV